MSIWPWILTIAFCVVEFYKFHTNSFEFNFIIYGVVDYTLKLIINIKTLT